MIEPLAARLAEAPFVILDGGLATELERDGCGLDDPLWSARMLLDAPARITRVHARYVAAGVDLLTSASYQATIPGLVAAGRSAAEARVLLARSVELARAAALASDHPPLIAASIGSYGAYLADGSEYRGDDGLEPAALADFHRPRLDALARAGPDLLAFETIPSHREAAAIAELLAASEGPPAWVSFSLQPGPGRPTISDRTALDDAIAPLLGHPRVIAVGVNCVGPSEILPALERLAARAPGLAPIVYPNSGERWEPRGWAGPTTSPASFAALARTWVEAGAKIIGGCCRTGPAHVEALAALRRAMVDLGT